MERALARTIVSTDSDSNILTLIDACPVQTAYLRGCAWEYRLLVGYRAHLDYIAACCQFLSLAVRQINRTML